MIWNVFSKNFYVRWSEIGLMLLLVGVQLLTLKFHFYQTTNYFDEVMHYLNPLSITYFSTTLAYRNLVQNKQNQRVVVVALVFFANASLAALWEITEWFTFKYLWFPQIRIADTIMDMTIHIAAVVAGLGVWHLVDRYQNN